MTGIYVLTSPRKTDDRWSYVRAVAEHIEGEELSCGKYVVCDGTTDDVRELGELLPGGWTVERYARPEGTWIGGNKWPYWKLLEVALSTTHEHEDALVLEDDLDFCTNAVQRMLLLPIPRDVDCLQFFSAWLFGVPIAKPCPGLWRSPALVQGCQAIKFPRRTLARLVEWAGLPEWQKYNESDVALGLAQQRLGLRFANHMPDLVQHAGHVSVVSHGMFQEAGITDAADVDFANKTLGGRVSANWPGKSFDAMKLFVRHELYR